MANAHPDKQGRVKMECPTCGYKSFPQWMNDKAHCLKCDSVLKARPSCQDTDPTRYRYASPVTHPVRHQVTKQDRLKEKFREYDKNGDGTLTFDEMEVLLRKGDASISDTELRALYDSMDKNHNGVIEFNEFVDYLYSQNEPADHQTQQPGIPPAKLHPDRQNRVKMECPVCGYKSFPQWMNDEAHCLKCDTVLKRRPVAGGGSGRGWGTSQLVHDQPSSNSNQETLAESLGFAMPTSGVQPIAKKHPDFQHRQMIECHQCGYRSYPSWFNDEAHCLKCDAVVKRRRGCQEKHAREAVPLKFRAV